MTSEALEPAGKDLDSRRPSPLVETFRMKRMGLACALLFMSAAGVSIASIPAQAVPMCLGKRATIVGTSGVDTIYGTAGPDVIVGLASQDLLFGRGGADRICGG